MGGARVLVDLGGGRHEHQVVFPVQERFFVRVDRKSTRLNSVT